MDSTVEQYCIINVQFIFLFYSSFEIWTGRAWSFHFLSFLNFFELHIWRELWNYVDSLDKNVTIICSYEIRHKWNINKSCLFTCCCFFVKTVWLHKILTCSRHRNFQNIRIPILQIFVFVYWRGTRNHFYWSIIFFGPMKMFSCPPSINKSKDLENWNSNILEVPMSRTSWNYHRKARLIIFKR